jgi:hypothetical protein
MQLVACLERGKTIAALSDDIGTGIGDERTTKGLSHERLVVSDQDSKRSGHSRPGGEEKGVATTIHHILDFARGRLRRTARRVVKGRGGRLA